MAKTFEVFYYNKLPLGKKELSHKYTETWEKTNYNCANCGRRGVWQRQDGGDLYVGPQYICIGCGHFFYLPDGVLPVSFDTQDSQRLKHLRT